MTALERAVLLHDLDLLLDELRAPRAVSRLRSLGLEAPDAAAVEGSRATVAQGLERRWLLIYERARARYGRGMAAVRERVCQGCFITLPTSAAPAGDALLVCESCARILYWR